MKDIITLVATDLDGTFLTSDKKVTEENLKAISRLHEKGILFGIASGRPIETVRTMTRDWGIYPYVSFIMGMNGGVLYDFTQRIKEDYHMLDGEAVLDIIHHFKDLDVQFQVLIGETRFVSRSTWDTLQSARMLGEYEVIVDMEKFLLDRAVNKLVIWCNPEYMPKVIERSKSLHREDCVGFNTAAEFFEYVDPAINKGYGLKKVCKHFGVLPKHCMVFGDEANDLAMLKLAGHSVAMKNAIPQAKECAKHITTFTNEESGVGRFIEDYIFND